MGNSDYYQNSTSMLTTGRRELGLPTLRYAKPEDLEKPTVCVGQGVIFKTVNYRGENIFALWLYGRIITKHTDRLIEVKWPQSTWKS